MMLGLAAIDRKSADQDFERITEGFHNIGRDTFSAQKQGQNTDSSQAEHDYESQEDEKDQ